MASTSATRCTGIAIPPSPNWYLSSLASRTPARDAVAYAAHNLVVVLSVPEQRVLCALSGHGNRVTAVSFLGASAGSEGKALLVSAAADRSARLWEVTLRTSPSSSDTTNATGNDLPKPSFVSAWRCLQLARNLGAAVAAIATIQDEHCPMDFHRLIWLGDGNGNVLSWVAGAQGKPTKLQTFDKGVFSLAAVAAAGRTKVAVGLVNGTVHIICGETGEALASTAGAHRGEVQSLDWTWTASAEKVSDHGPPGGSLGLLPPEASGGNEGNQELPEAQCDDCAGPGAGRGQLLLASAGPDRTIIIWAEDGSVKQRLKAPKPDTGLGEGSRQRLWLTAQWAGALGPGGGPLLLSSGYGGAAMLWEVPSEGSGAVRPPARLPKVHIRSIFSITPLPPQYGPDGRAKLCYATCSMDRSVCLWSMQLPAQGASSAGPVDVSQAVPEATAPESLPSTAASSSVAWTLQGLGGHVYKLACSPPAAVDCPPPQRCIAVACGDSTMRLWFPLENRHHLLWRGISSKVLVVAWHPLEPGIVAYGMEDGTVACVDCHPGKREVAMASWGQAKHSGPVVSLAWHPSTEWAKDEEKARGEESADLDRGTAEPEGALLRLFSCGAEGAVLQWPAIRRSVLSSASHGASSAGTLVGTPTDHQEALQLKTPCTALGWEGSGGSHLALGTGGGEISVFNRQATASGGWGRLGEGLRRHSRAVNCVRWSPAQPSATDSTLWLAACGEDGVISITRCITSNGESGRGELEAWAVVSDLKGPVHDCDWTGLSDGSGLVLAAACADGAVRCWTMTRGVELGGTGRDGWGPPQPLVVMRGHTGRVLSVSWDRSAPGPELASGGEDQTVRLWDPFDEAYAPAALTGSGSGGPSRPASSAAGTVPSTEQDTKEGLAGGAGAWGSVAKRQPAAQAAAPDVTGDAPISSAEGAPTIVGGVERPGAVDSPDKAEADQQTPSQAAATAPAAGGAKRARQRKVASLAARPLLMALSTRESPQAQASASRSCLRLAIARQGRDSDGGGAEPPGDDGGDGGAGGHQRSRIVTAVWNSPVDAASALAEEASSVRPVPGDAPSAASEIRAAQRSAALLLWAGDVSGAVECLMRQEGALTGEYVGMAAAAGRAAWEAVSRAFAARQEAAGEVHSAALHLLAIGDISVMQATLTSVIDGGAARPAVQTYRRAGLLVDAIALASCRLVESDPLLLELHALQASALEGAGEWEAAACHHVAVSAFLAAVEALSRRRTPEAIDSASQLATLRLEALRSAEETAGGSESAAGAADDEKAKLESALRRLEEHSVQPKYPQQLSSGQPRTAVVSVEGEHGDVNISSEESHNYAAASVEADELVAQAPAASATISNRIAYSREEMLRLGRVSTVVTRGGDTESPHAVPAGIPKELRAAHQHQHQQDSSLDAEAATGVASAHSPPQTALVSAGSGGEEQRPPGRRAKYTTVQLLSLRQQPVGGTEQQAARAMLAEALPHSALTLDAPSVLVVASSDSADKETIRERSSREHVAFTREQLLSLRESSIGAGALLKRALEDNLPASALSFNPSTVGPSNG